MDRVATYDHGIAEPGFVIVEPVRQTAPVVFNSPHSGQVYPARLLAAARLDAMALRRSEDCYIDEVFACAAGLGCPLLAAEFPRAWLDVNREPWELDPSMFATALPDTANVTSARVAGGLGTIPRIVAEGEDIYAAKLDWREAEDRIRRFYFPYHEALRGLMARTFRAFGKVVLVDCHSMPSAAGLTPPGRPDIVLGDRHGAACAGAIVALVEAGFARHGLKVARNRPYAGGHITQRYGQPQDGVHALQVEINRSLYVNERTLERTRGFAVLQGIVRDVMAGLVGALCAGDLRPPLAAE